MGNTRAFFIRFLMLPLFFLFAGSFSTSVASGTEISILLMPLEPIEQEMESFSIDDAKYSPYLIFDNTSKEWEELELGRQHWICNQLDKFAKAEDVKIKIRFISWDRAFYEITAHGRDYDVIQVPSTWTAYLSEEKILIPFLDDPDTSSFPQNLLRTCHLEGSHEIYGIPWQIDLRALYVRNELADDPSMLTTFETFSQCLKDRKESQIDKGPLWQAPLGISLNKDWNILHDTFRYFLGGSLIEKDGDGWKAIFTKEEALAGIEQLIHLQKDELVYFESCSNQERTDWKVMAQGLIDGRYDAVFGGLYMMSLFDQNPETKIYALALPSINNKPMVSFLGGSNLGMTSVRGKNLIIYLTTYENGVSMYKSTVAFPANLKALKEFFVQNPQWHTFRIDNTLESASSYPSIPQWATIIEDQTGLDQFYNALESISNGRDYYSVSVELNAAAKDIQNAVDKSTLIEKRDKNWILYIIILSLIIVVLIVLRCIILKIETVKADVERIPEYLDPILNILLPPSRVTIGECEFHADFNYDFISKCTTLELKFLHNNTLLRRPWKMPLSHSSIIFFFELLVYRKVVTSHMYAELNLSDFILYRGLVNIRNPNTNKPQKSIAAPQKCIARFRTEIFKFVNNYCVMKDCFGKDIDKKCFLIEPTQLSTPRYRFVLEDQVFLFKSNIVDTTEAIDQLPQSAPDAILPILYECPRCLRGWAALCEFSQQHFTQEQLAFIQTGKEMLENDRIKYARAAQDCQSPNGQILLEIYGEDLTDVPRELDAWATTLQHIVTGLP